MSHRRRSMRAALASAGVVLLALACEHRPASDHASRPALPPEAEVDLSGHFTGVDPGDASFVVSHAATGAVIRFNPARAKQRYIPASTFKIANSLIALETGVANGPDHAIAWDSATSDGFWADSWSRDHTMRSAMQNSVYWYYQQLAREIGADRMQQYLDAFDYGNRNMGGGLDRFWLGGDLRISPDEQVRFLRRMYAGDLGVSDRTTQIVKELLVLESSSNCRISGKTGTAEVTPTRELAWLVGYAECGPDTWFFALNVEGELVWEQWGAPAARLALVRQLLDETVSF